jgi:hypothetical protein
MNVTRPHVPASITGDSNDVVTALDVANALWEKGNNAEAVRWVNRAIEAAGEAGDGARAADLARAAGELEAAIAGRLAPVASVPPPVESGPPSVPPPSATPTEPCPDSSERVLVPSAVPLAEAPAGASAGPLAIPLVLPPNAAFEMQARHEAWMRVSVKTSVRDPKLFVLRPLADGEAAPAGTREGFLLLADSKVHGQTKPNGGGTA